VLYTPQSGPVVLSSEIPSISANESINWIVFAVQPEWIHHTAWKGKGDVYHIIFDTTLVSASKPRVLGCRTVVSPAALHSPWPDKCHCCGMAYFGAGV